MAMLELSNVTKKYGELVAVDDVSFEIDDGELPALIGPNGAGKTTMYNLLTGKITATEGRIEFKGEDVTSLPTDDLTRRGIGRSFQITNVFPGLTVQQNIRAPVVARSDARWDARTRVEENDPINEETAHFLDLLGLSDIVQSPAENLSYGDKRRVEIGIALATDPDLLLLDEPTAGMNPVETDNMVNLIQRLDDETDTTFMITEHDMEVVFRIASRILVLNRGEIIADGLSEDVRGDPHVQSAYLGEEVEE